MADLLTPEVETPVAPLEPIPGKQAIASPNELAQHHEEAPAGTVSLVGRDGGLHAVPAAKAAAAVQSGQYGWVHGSSIPIVDPGTGLIKQVHSTEATAALAQKGARLATPEEAAAAEREEKYGGLGGMAAAGGEGLARGLSAGLSDPLAVGAAKLFGGEKAAAATRGHLAAEKAVNPGIAIGSEVTGAVLPMFFGDEAGIAGVLGSIPRGIDAAGELGSLAARKLVGAGAEGILGKAAQKAVAGAARGIVEGGLWGAGQEVSDATLENRGLVAENVLAAAGHGALLAGVLGGALGAASPVAEHVWGKVRSGTDGLLDKMADEQYVRALSSNKKSFIEQMTDRFGGGSQEEATSRIANRLRSEKIVEAGDDIEKIAAKAAKAETSAVEGLSEQVDKLGSSGVRVEDVLSNLEKRAGQFEKELGHAPAAAAIRDQMKGIADIYKDRALEAVGKGISPGEFEIPIKELLAQRRTLEKTINWQTDSVVAAGKKAAGRTLEDSIMQAGEDAAAKAGDKSWVAEYKAAKARYAETRFINDVAQDSIAAKLRNRMVSPSDYGASLLGGNVGSMLGMGHGAMSGVAGGGLLGMASGALHHAVRERGNATAAVLLDKLGTFSGLSEMHAGAMGRLDGAIKGALTHTTRTAMSGKTDFSAGRFEKEAKRVSTLAAAPAAIDRHLESQTAALGSHAPDVASEVRIKATSAVKYLTSKLPASYSAPTSPLTPQVKGPVSASERNEFLRAVDTVEDPEDAVRRVLRGHGGVVEVDALKANFPEYYAETQKRVLSLCSSRTKAVPYQTAVRLGTLFDAPTDLSLTPDSMMVQQQMYAGAKTQGGAPGNPKGRGSTTKPLKTTAMMASMFSDKTEEGG